MFNIDQSNRVIRHRGNNHTKNVNTREEIKFFNLSQIGSEFYTPQIVILSANIPYSSNMFSNLPNLCPYLSMLYAISHLEASYFNIF